VVIGDADDVIADLVFYAPVDIMAEGGVVEVVNV
jgi:hypothetical protein